MVEVSIFEGEGQCVDYLCISFIGMVLVIQLEDGCVLVEFNVILMYLVQGMFYLFDDVFGCVKVWQWLSFEQEWVELVIGVLCYWMFIGKFGCCVLVIVEVKQVVVQCMLVIFECELSLWLFLVGDVYIIVDIVVFVYGSCVEEVGLVLDVYLQLCVWIVCVVVQFGYFVEMYLYWFDLYFSGELF